jgi:hypothetical protein
MNSFFKELPHQGLYFLQIVLDPFQTYEPNDTVYILIWNPMFECKHNQSRCLQSSVFS